MAGCRLRSEPALRNTRGAMLQQVGVARIVRSMTHEGFCRACKQQNTTLIFLRSGSCLIGTSSAMCAPRQLDGS